MGVRWRDSAQASLSRVRGAGHNRLMTVVVCSEDLCATALEAERLWYDVERWSSFVEGFGAVERMQGSWPASGGVLEWSSTPHGRGQVTERMLEHESARRAVSEVSDDRL